MGKKKDLGEQILGHLQLYDDLGVRWVRKGQKKVSPHPNARAEKAGSGSAAGPRKPAAAGRAAAAQAPAADVTTSKAVPSNESLDMVRADLNGCRRCKLAPTRKNIVFGAGNPNAELMFVGEAPGADEDEQGLPFVGRAGQLLTKIIESIGIDRKEVFICNILKCRPPGNRNPETDEIAACEQFLFRQIAAVKPKIICALGAFGAQTLLKTSEAIGRLRGRLIDYRGVKMIATFHPAYLLRNPYEKRKVWEDMRIVKQYLDSLHS